MAKKKKSTDVNETDSEILRAVAKDNNKPRLTRSVKKAEESGQPDRNSAAEALGRLGGLKGEKSYPSKNELKSPISRPYPLKSN